MQSKLIGIQLVIELLGCQQEILEHTDKVKSVMDQAALIISDSVVNSVFHQFNPFGVSGVVVVRGGHLAIHTWPEHNYAAVDLFIGLSEEDIEQSEDVNQSELTDFLQQMFYAKDVKVKRMNRETI